MNTDLSGQIAIVTGGSKGYGVGIAEVLHERGAEVWITGRDKGVLQRTAKRLSVHALRADVAEPKDWDRLFDEVTQRAGRLDILVNNAGAGVRIAPLAEQSDEDIARSLAVNLTGAIYGCRRAAPIMVKQGSGTIVNISSVCARQAWPGWSVYSAAKAGMVHLGRCLYTELRPAGVRVTTVIPSWGNTEFLEAADLGVRAPEQNARCIQPRELGELVAGICALPAHLAIQDVTFWPMIQEVIPL